MGRGSGDETAGTGSPLHTSRKKSEDESRDYRLLADLLDKGERVFLDSRSPRADKDFWYSIAALQTIPCKDLELEDESSLEGIRDFLAQPMLLFIRPGEMFSDDNFQSIVKNLSSGKNEFQDVSGAKYNKHPEAIVAISDEKGLFQKAPAWLSGQDSFLSPSKEEFVFDLTTEELGLLSSGQRPTFAQGTKVFKIAATDLDCSTRELAEGRDARVGNVVLRYS